MSILLFTIISMSENERRHNAKSVMSGLSHFCPPHHCLRTNCCAKLDPLLKSSNCNVLCVCDQTQTNVESKLHYCDVQSGFRAKCAHCFSYAIRFYTKKVDENFSCRSNCLRVHHPLQKSVFIVLQLQTPTSIVITLVCGWKGSSKDKEVQKKSSVLSNLASSVKLQTTIEVWVQSRQINKSRELCQETRRGCRKGRALKEQKRLKIDFASLPPPPPP